MLIYRGPVGGAGRPPWLEGRRGVVEWQAVAGHYAAIAADPGDVGVPEEGAWRRCGDDWEVAGELDPAELLKDQAWCSLVPIADMRGRSWPAPLILRPDGGRAFRCSYGDASGRWGPIFTEEQQELAGVAEEAYQAVLADCASEDRAGAPGLPIEAACDWASRLYAATMYLDRGGRVIRAMGVMDEVLAMRTLFASFGADPARYNLRPAEEGAPEIAAEAADPLDEHGGRPVIEDEHAGEGS